MRPPNINRTIQHARRYQEILSVLLRYGFQDAVYATGLDRWSGFGRRFQRSEEEAEEKLPRAVRVRKALETLGPIFIKMGQVLSTRPDLIPPAWAEEFGNLQADCPRLPFAEIRRRLQEEFNDDLDTLFLEIEPNAFAAGSLAQVHRGVLRTGETVAIKVLRPGVEQKVALDLEVLGNLAALAERYFVELGYSPIEVIEELSRHIRREVDLSFEARATERFRELFADDKDIGFPKVYWEASSSGVLTLEFIEGRLLSQVLESPPDKEACRKIVAAGTDAIFRQCLDYGYFHADPHPGNLIVTPDNRIYFIDCGMTGHIDRKTTELLADMIAGVLSSDLDLIIGSVMLLSQSDFSIGKNRAFRREVWEIAARFEHTTFQSLQVGALLEDVLTVLRKYRIRIPADLTLLVKALTTIENAGARLAPSFDLVEQIRPHIAELLDRRYGVRAIKERLGKTFMRYGRLVEELPEGMEGLLSRLHSNRFAITLQHQGLTRLTDTVEHASRNISYALLIAALLVGSSILLLSASIAEQAILMKTMGLVGLVICAVVAVLMVAANRLRRR